MPAHHRHGERCRFSGCVIHREDDRHREVDSVGHEQHCGVHNDHQQAVVEANLLQISMADTAGNDRCYGHIDCKRRNQLQLCDVLCDGIGGNGGGAEGGDQTQQKKFSQLEHPVFQSVWNADIQNFSNQKSVWTIAQCLFIIQRTVLIQQQERDHKGGHGAGRQCGNACTVRIHSEAVDESGISAEVDDVHHAGDQHRIAGVSHRPENGGTGLINGHHRDGKGSQDQVFICIGIDLRCDFSEDQRHETVPENQKEQTDKDTGQKHKPDQLLCASACILFSLCPKVLSCDDSASRCHRGEDHDDQLHDLIDKRYAGNSGFVDAGDHDRVEHADKKCQKQVENQRPDQLKQSLPAEQISFFYSKSHRSFYYFLSKLQNQITKIYR